MSKANSGKAMVIRVPDKLFEKFRNKCKENYKTMSEAVRDFIQQYIRKENGG